MSYRDDDDAARARADALQVDLDQARDELAAAEAKLAARETELAASEAEKMLLEARAEKAAKATPRKAAGKQLAPKWVGFVSVAVPVAAILAVVVLWAARDRAEKQEREEEERTARNAQWSHDSERSHTPRSCTVHTIPEGATLVMIDRAGTEQPLGTTPTFVPLDRWTLEVFVEARFTGYEPLKLLPPFVTGTRCNETYSLTRASR